MYAVYVAVAAASLSEMWGEVQRAAGAMERLVELQERASPRSWRRRTPSPLPAAGAGPRSASSTCRSAIRRAPRPLRWTTSTLAIAPGETVAFVGPSGAGKSTTFQLLLRFYDPAGGPRARRRRRHRARRSATTLRERIGLVPQDTVLFGASARENIRYGRPGASDAEIEAAARAAAADEFIRRLPQGYDTFLGERGTRLSGGQRQRIAIARAILQGPADPAARRGDERARRARASGSCSRRSSG